MPENESTKEQVGRLRRIASLCSRKGRMGTWPAYPLIQRGPGGGFLQWLDLAAFPTPPALRFELLQ